MMMSMAEAEKNIVGDSGNRRLLYEIEAISKALYLDKNRQMDSTSSSSSRSKSVSKTHLSESKSNLKKDNEDLLQKEKKSIWNWSPLRALSHIRNRRFNCCFTLQVHRIEGLPQSFDDLSLSVHWRRRDGHLVTRPAKVLQGIAEFEENLMHTCSVYGSRSGSQHSAKYEAKHFLLYAAFSDAPGVDFGKHRVDLTRLLPLTLEELEEDKGSGKWSTSFRLTGQANEATLNVSFGYMVIADNAVKQRQNVPKSSKNEGRVGMRRSGSLPVELGLHSHASSSSSMEDIKDLHEVLPMSRSDLATSVDMLYQKLDEGKTFRSSENIPELETLYEKFDEEKPFSSSENKPELETLYEKFDEEKPFSSSENKPERDGFVDDHESGKPSPRNLDVTKQFDQIENDLNDFTVIEQGVELSSKENPISEHVISETAVLATSVSHDAVESNLKSLVQEQLDSEMATEISYSHQGSIVTENEVLIRDCITNDDDVCSKESLMKELQAALETVANLEVAALDSPEHQADYIGLKTRYKLSREGKSLSIDETTESVETEFLNMLGTNHSSVGMSPAESEPDSPRERLLRQFEKEAMAGGYSLFDFGTSDVYLRDDAASSAFLGNVYADIELPSAPVEEQEAPNHVKSKSKAQVLEDLETEALMRQWGLDDNVFQASPLKSAGSGFGSPVDLPPEESFELPPLADGLGPYLQTKTGGFLRSMSPSIFKKAKNSGNLIMQASSPVVVPAEMGSDVMEILQCLASVGMEKLSMQANKLMPLEDITGKTMNQVAMEASPSLEGINRQHISQHDGQDAILAQKMGREKKHRYRSSKITSGSLGNEVRSEYVSLEDLAPLALDKIEALSMEGLRIQSGMSDDDAPSNISAKSIGEISTLQGKRLNVKGSLGLDGTAGLQLLGIQESSEDVDGLMGLSLSLSEWMKLDSGEIGEDDDKISERTSKILAAHHANSLNMIRGGGGSKGERRRGSKKGGLLGNNFTVALMVQLRDPLRNYEPVGAPMLALIQVERMFVPPKPTIFRKVSSVVTRHEEDDDEAVELIKQGKEDEKVPEQQFKITEVHVAGLESDAGKKKAWGSKAEKQSGSRWLLANGMGKSNKNPLMKSKPISKSTGAAAGTSTNVQSGGDTLWSISSRVHGDGSKWKGLATLNPRVRNPNVILPKTKFR